MRRNYTVLGCLLRNLIFLLLAAGISPAFVRLSQLDSMKCFYGERGSLTAICVNATPSYFKNTPYRFDHLDETLKCVNCTLKSLESSNFDISGNQIRNLDLSYSFIETIRPRAFVGLIFLDKLILSNNEIQSIEPGTFSSIKKLTYVDLKNNSIGELKDEGFSELVNLNTLNLKNNKIKTIAQKAFTGLESLQILDIGHNEIPEVKGVFDNLTKLEQLDLSDNKISHLNEGDFKNLTALKEIRLTLNLIKEIPVMGFSYLMNLRKLDLTHNSIEKIYQGSFNGLRSLEELYLCHNNISEIPNKAFLGLHSLLILELSYNNLSIMLTGSYSGLPQMRHLNLSNNVIQDIEVTGVLNLENLHILDVSKNNISQVDYAGLITRLPKISFLDLEDNYLPCDLEREMEKYFADDNFKFILYRNEANAVQCVDSPIIPSKIRRNYTSRSLVKSETEYHSNASAIICIFILISIILLLIGFLYYSQFRIYRELKARNSFSFHSATSQVRLISSDVDLEDNDDLKE